MKKILLSTATLLALAAMPFCAYAEDDVRTWAERCDVNGDGQVTVGDISTIVEYLLGNITDNPATPDDPVTPDDPYNLNGHEAVDLGLSVRWAATNATGVLPADYGAYVQWGETHTEWDDDDNIYNGPYNATSSVTISKSIEQLYNEGFIDENGVLNLQCDAAHTFYGGDWRLPTKEEWQEFFEKCTFQVNVSQVDSNGNSRLGSLVTGPNGNSIFMPYCGYYSNKNLNREGTAGKYWSSTVYENASDKTEAYCSIVQENIYGTKVTYDSRGWGMAVRGVIGK